MKIKAGVAFALCLLLGAAAHAQGFPVVPGAGHPFDSWGIALAWEPVEIDQLPLAPEQKREIADRMLDILFTTKPVDIGKAKPVEGMGLNGIRYVMQGGQNPSILAELKERASKGGREFCARCWAPGWAPAPGQWDDAAEPAQRYWLKGAIERIRARGARPLTMLTANAPPYWMTLDGSSAGAPEALKPNIDGNGINQYAAYQVRVLEALRQHVTPEANWGVDFDMIGPLNEPNNNVWTKYNNQEGLYLPHWQQADLLRAVAITLRNRGLATPVSGNDDSRIGETDAYNSQFSALGTFEDVERDPARADVMNMIGQITVHSYLGDRRRDLAALAYQFRKTIIVSEVGCCVDSKKDGTKYKDSFGTTGGFWMADHIRRDVLDMGARGWYIWQPDWGILKVDNSGKFLDYPQFWLLRFMMGALPAGSLVLNAGNGNTIVSIEDKGDGHGWLHVLAINTRFGPATASSVQLDLSRFERLSAKQGYRATAAGGQSDYFKFDAVDIAPILAQGRFLNLPMPQESITALSFEFYCPPGCARPH
jgi:hypothetical protein